MDTSTAMWLVIVANVAIVAYILHLITVPHKKAKTDKPQRKCYDNALGLLSAEQGEWYVNVVLERELAKIFKFYSMYPAGVPRSFTAAIERDANDADDADDADDANDADDIEEDEYSDESDESDYESEDEDEEVESDESEDESEEDNGDISVDGRAAVASAKRAVTRGKIPNKKRHDAPLQRATEKERAIPLQVPARAGAPKKRKPPAPRKTGDNPVAITKGAEQAAATSADRGKAIAGATTATKVAEAPTAAASSTASSTQPSTANDAAASAQTKQPALPLDWKGMMTASMAGDPWVQNHEDNIRAGINPVTMPRSLAQRREAVDRAIENSE